MIALQKITTQLRNLSGLFGSAGYLADALESAGLGNYGKILDGYYDIAYDFDEETPGWDMTISFRSHVYSGPMSGRAFMPEFTVGIFGGRLACLVGIGVHGCGVEFDLASGVPTYIWADSKPSCQCWGDCRTQEERCQKVARCLEGE